MATIAEQLTSLANTKTAIKDAIIAKGVEVTDTDPFSAYAGKIGQIQGGTPVTKLGLSIDDFIGEVKDGVVSAPSATPVIDFSGVETVGELAFKAFFQGKKGWIKNVNEIKEVSDASFKNMFMFSPSLTTKQPVSFDSLEELTTGINAFESFADSADSPLSIAQKISFPALKVIGGQNMFKRAFKPLISETLPATFVDDLFPVLEEIEGYCTFDNFIYYGNKPILTFSKVKKITGKSNNNYDAIFGSFYSAGTVWNFPSATELSGYIWNVSSSYAGEIHFAAVNQTTIETCSDYDKKWGFAGATIFFDLMLNITVNGIVYSRNCIINGYTSWEDESGNLVYTDATAEPTVGTIVYSDQGTTQVGTVEEVA